MRPDPSCQGRARLKRRMRCRSKFCATQFIGPGQPSWISLLALPTFQTLGRGENPRPRSNVVFRLCRCRLGRQWCVRPAAYDDSRAAKVENDPRLCAASRWFQLQARMFGSALCHEHLRCCEFRHGRKTEGSDSAVQPARGPQYRRWFHQAHDFAKR